MDKPVNEDIKAYYHARAKEYDTVYENPDEQQDLRLVTETIQELFAGKEVLELACGTGYWTERIAVTAAAVFATDINPPVIDIAMARQKQPNITYSVADMYTPLPGKKFGGLFCGFIWSHLPLQDIDRFLNTACWSVEEGATMVFIDSSNTPGAIHAHRPIAREDEQGNTYQERVLQDGSQHLILKNFPTEDFLYEKISPYATDIRVTHLQHYWVLVCRRKVKLSSTKTDI